MFLAIIRADGKFYLMLNKQHEVVSWSSEAEALAFFERGYARHNAMGHEGSMSAVVHNCYFQPSIIEVPDTAYINKHIIHPSRKILGLTCVAGFMVGVEATHHAAVMWKKGSRPSVTGRTGLRRRN